LGASTSSLNILSKLGISGLEDIDSTESVDIDKPTVNKFSNQIRISTNHSSLTITAEME
jgi:hypothetical protein